ncbi:MAG TPA: response regulator transcription factor [Gemmatimonadaceae bacterium]|nr:response regulator transcription factor [Gemmatimonadaceae bacterium]
MSLPLPQKLRILVVDDEPEIVALVAYHLTTSGYEVVTAADGQEALAAARQNRMALVILDLMLPDMSGFQVLSALRANPRTRDAAVLMLTALREDADRIRGLSLGADDYLTKPFNPEELVLRVRAILRRGRVHHTPEQLSAIGDVTIDRQAHRVKVRGAEVVLTPTEYRLLLLMMENAGQVQQRQHLLQAIWGAEPDMQTRTVDVHVQRLRSKLGVAGDMIETVRGFGYRFSGENANT